mgnify:FL=1
MLSYPSYIPITQPYPPPTILTSQYVPQPMYPPSYYGLSAVPPMQVQPVGAIDKTGFSTTPVWGFPGTGIKKSKNNKESKKKQKPLFKKKGKESQESDTENDDEMEEGVEGDEESYEEESIKDLENLGKKKKTTKATSMKSFVDKKKKKGRGRQMTELSAEKKDVSFWETKPFLLNLEIINFDLGFKKIKQLLEVPDAPKDWNSQSNILVLELLFPLLYTSPIPFFHNLHPYFLHLILSQICWDLKGLGNICLPVLTLPQNFKQKEKRGDSWFPIDKIDKSNFAITAHMTTVDSSSFTVQKIEIPAKLTQKAVNCSREKAILTTTIRWVVKYVDGHGRPQKNEGTLYHVISLILDYSKPSTGEAIVFDTSDFITSEVMDIFESVITTKFGIEPQNIYCVNEIYPGEVDMSKCLEEININGRCGIFTLLWSCAYLLNATLRKDPYPLEELVALFFDLTPENLLFICNLFLAKVDIWFYKRFGRCFMSYAKKDNPEILEVKDWLRKVAGPLPSNVYCDIEKILKNNS